MTYDDHFYESIRKTTVKSADLVAPIVLLQLASCGYTVDSLVDVGGGQGWWAKAFNDIGVDKVMCIDGGYVHNPVVPFVPWDLNTFGKHGLMTPAFHYDMTVCLEVGEHLDPERANGLVETLAYMAPVCLFSAAIPEQGGEHHVNEQPPSYWSRLFESYDFVMSGYLRDLIWDDEDIASWYRQNLMLCMHRSVASLRFPAGFYTGVPADERIHPDTGNPRLETQ